MEKTFSVGGRVELLSPFTPAAGATIPAGTRGYITQVYPPHPLVTVNLDGHGERNTHGPLHLKKVHPDSLEDGDACRPRGPVSAEIVEIARRQGRLGIGVGPDLVISSLVGVRQVVPFNDDRPVRWFSAEEFGRRLRLDATHDNKPDMEEQVNGSALGGWAMGRAMFDWVLVNVSPDEVVLELGSGSGSIELARRRTLVSLEHDAQWVPRSNGNAVVYAPIQDGWYDRRVAAAVFAATMPHVVLVDGPPAAIGRVGFLDFFLVFWKTPAAGRCRAVVFDDTDRPAELELAARFADLTGWALERHVDGTKAFTVAKRPH